MVRVEYLALVRERRHRNQVFGIGESEKWSGSHHLIDFLEELLTVERPIEEKLKHPVRRFPQDKQETDANA